MADRASSASAGASTAAGEKVKHYYVPESVGIATGFLIASLHNAGLATLTHTPSPMGFLNEICGRPDSEKAYILLVVGYPARRLHRAGHHQEGDGRHIGLDLRAAYCSGMLAAHEGGDGVAGA